MRGLHRRYVIAFAAAIVLSHVAISNLPADDPSGDKWFVDRLVTVSPMDAPIPAFRYRLYPLEWERKDGNAVPIFLRLVHEQSDAARKYWMEAPRPWNAVPIDKIPMTEAREFLARMAYAYGQLDLGARRKTADWSFTFDQGSVVGLAIPDVQSMRGYVPMLVLRARVLAAEGDFAAAVRALETGFAFSRQVAAAPILISGLVAISAAGQFADATLDVVERPGAPNLYWALTALPRPFIDLRTAWDYEQRFFEMEFPDLLDLNRTRSPAEWNDMLKRLRVKMKEIAATLADDANRPAAPIAGTGPDDPAANSPDLVRAKEYLAKRSGWSASRIGAMPPAQVLMLYLDGVLHDFRDQRFTAIYLPPAQAREQLRRTMASASSAPDTEAVRIVRIWMPAIDKVITAQSRLERKIAALRVIEALRIHAVRQGQLPDSLSHIQEVPVPIDPGTGEAFEYRKTGATATLTSRVPGEPVEKSGLRYTILLRN